MKKAKERRVMNVRIYEKNGKYELGFVNQLFKVSNSKDVGWQWGDAANRTVERLERKLKG